MSVVEKEDVGCQGARVFVHKQKGSKLRFVGNGDPSAFRTVISPHALDFPHLFLSRRTGLSYCIITDASST
jgi:hypothetical protein